LEWVTAAVDTVDVATITVQARTWEIIQSALNLLAGALERT
jgi:hypothetical protein